MRTFVCVCYATLFLAAILSAQQETPTNLCSSQATDRYCLAFVRSALDFAKKKGGDSFEAKAFTLNSPSVPQLGDGVSVATLKIYGASELAKPENAEAYLTLVRLGFSDRSKIVDAADADPKITLFTLEFLRNEERSNVALEKRISYMIECVNSFTCSPQNERSYFKSH